MPRTLLESQPPYRLVKATVALPYLVAEISLR
jgi:hypothetical protein